MGNGRNWGYYRSTLSGLDYVDRDSGVHKSGLSLLSEELRHSKGFSQTS